MASNMAKNIYNIRAQFKLRMDSGRRTYTEVPYMIAIEPKIIKGMTSMADQSCIETTVPEVLLRCSVSEVTNSIFIALYIGMIELRMGIKSPIKIAYIVAFGVGVTYGQNPISSVNTF